MGKLGSDCIYIGKGAGSEKTKKTLSLSPRLILSAGQKKNKQTTSETNRNRNKKPASSEEEGKSDFQKFYIIRFKCAYFFKKKRHVKKQEWSIHREKRINIYCP